MKRSIITAVGLALTVNAGVLLALPLLGGALEAALPQRPVYELRDVDLVRFVQPQARAELPMHRPPAAGEQEHHVVQREPEAPGPFTEPESAERLNDLLREIEIDIETEAFVPEVDLTLPETIAAGHGAGPGAGTAEKLAWSPGEVDRLPLKIYHVQPVYPLARLEQGVEAAVVLSFTIGADGAVSDVRIQQGSDYSDFDGAAIEALRRWRFAPALVGDKAVTVRAVQRIRFSLR